MPVMEITIIIVFFVLVLDNPHNNRGRDVIEMF